MLVGAGRIRTGKIAVNEASFTAPGAAPRVQWIDKEKSPAAAGLSHGSGGAGGQASVTSVTPATTRTVFVLATGVAGAVPPTWRAIFLKVQLRSVLVTDTTA